MRMITAPEKYERKSGDITVFLAGGITNCHNWQEEILKYLDTDFTPEITSKLVIFNPRRKNFHINDPNATEQQITWEFNRLEEADIFSMYFCAGESDQPICMYELGRYISEMQKRFPIDWKDRIIISSFWFKSIKSVSIRFANELLPVPEIPVIV